MASLLQFSEKKHVRKRESTLFWVRAQLAEIGWEKASIWNEDFAFYFFKRMAKLLKVPEKLEMFSLSKAILSSEKVLPQNIQKQLNRLKEEQQD